MNDFIVLMGLKGSPPKSPKNFFLSYILELKSGYYVSDIIFKDASNQPIIKHWKGEDYRHIQVVASDQISSDTKPRSAKHKILNPDSSKEIGVYFSINTRNGTIDEKTKSVVKYINAG